MTSFLHFLVQNTLAGTAFILLVVLFRTATRNLSKLYVRVLWLLALLVLVLPPLPLGSLRTARGLITETELALFGTGSTVPQPGQAPNGASASPKTGARTSEGAGTSPAGTPETQTGAGQTAGTSGEGSTVSATGKNDTTAGQAGTTGAVTSGIPAAMANALFLVWACGAVCFAAANLLQGLRLKICVSDAVRIGPDVWSSARIDAPFLMPGLPARIYIPSHLTENRGQLADILAHERMHLKNRDLPVKCAALLVLLVHWFNPVAWLALRLMNRDMEMYCDECVLRTADLGRRQRYAQTLLDFACKQSGFSPAVHFGESGTKSRIQYILKMKRPRRPTGALLMLLIAAFGLSFLTAGNMETEGAVNGPENEQLSGGTVSYRMQDSAQTVADDAAHTPGDTDKSRVQAGSGEAGNTADETFWADRSVVGAGQTGVKPDFDESQLTLLDETEHFTLYGIQEDENAAANRFEEGQALVVKAPDGCLILAEVPYTSTYNVPPVLHESDFDNDGEQELSIITYVMHGTGVSIESLFMADRTEGSTWSVFQYRDSDYLPGLEPHFDTKHEADGVRLLFHGRAVGVAEEVLQEYLDEDYAYYAGPQIDFNFAEGRILLRAELAGYSNNNLAGEFPGHELDAEVCYMGRGSWKLADVHYADSNINDLIDVALPLYLTGETEQVNENCTVPGVTLADFDDPAETVTILSVSYSAETLENNQADVHVTLRRDNNPDTDHLTIPVKRVALDFGGMWWRISGQITRG